MLHLHVRFGLEFMISFNYVKVVQILLIHPNRDGFELESSILMAII